MNIHEYQMSVAKIVGVLFLPVIALLSGCDRWSSEAEAKIPLTTAPGLSVPDVDQLATKLERTLRESGAKVVYTRQDGKLVEVKPVPLGKHFSAVVVRSFDAKQGMAYVELTDLGSNMPVVQIWRFDGKAWSDSVDPGIFVR